MIKGLSVYSRPKLVREFDHDVILIEGLLICYFFLVITFLEVVMFKINQYNSSEKYYLIKKNVRL